MHTSAQKKRSLGQYFTRKSVWLYPHIESFIQKANPSVIVDPFVGEGHLIEAFGGIETKGLDIEPGTMWEHNDSLKNIPKYKGGLILTNPPYLSNYSAKRKGLYAGVEQYFSKNPQHDDLYRIALDKCLESYDYVVAIIPETFINSSYPKNRLEQITIVEESLFDDTETPVCVACFGPSEQVKKTKVFRGSEFLDYYQDLLKLQIQPNNLYSIRFNDPTGPIGLRAVDMPDPHKSISFLSIAELGYDQAKIKESSRLITFVSLPDSLLGKTNQIIERSNLILSQFRSDTQDVLLSPFKGNNKNGNRRRRLDYATARGILESAIQSELQYAVKI